MVTSTRMEDPPVCLSIAGLDPSGGAGILADVRTFAAFGCFPSAALTSVTFQNTQGVYGSVAQTGEDVRRQLQPVFDDYRVNAVKTGMLPTRDVIAVVADVVSANRMDRLVVDPVVRSTSGFDLIDDTALEVLIEMLFPLSVLVTPNVPEAERISGIKVEDIGSAARAARKMNTRGASNVLIKGGHRFFERDEMDNGRAGEQGMIARDLLFLGDEVVIIDAEFIDTRATHGTGCVLSSAITACLARGFGLEDAVWTAKRFVTRAIRTAPQIGAGHSPINIDPEFAD